MSQTDWGHKDPAWAGIRDEMLELDTGPVRLLRADGTGPQEYAEPQLLVHGLGGSGSNWVDVMSGLTRYGPVVAMDLTGFGHTPAAGGPAITVDGHLSLVLSIADKLGWDRFALHGNSMGGLIATLMAARHPERVTRLVLVSPAFPPTSPLRLLAVPRTTVSGVLPIAIPSRAHSRAEAMLGLIFSDIDGIRPTLLQAMADDATPRDEQEAADHQRAFLSSTRSITAYWLTPPRVYRAVDAVTAPTIILGGTKDALVPAKVLRRVLARRRDWTGTVIDERRHALMLESPQEFLDAVARWRDRTDAAVA